MEASIYTTTSGVPRCGSDILAMVREVAPRERAVFAIGDITYVVDRLDKGVEILPSRFKFYTYAVSGDDGSSSLAEFIHCD